MGMISILFRPEKQLFGTERFLCRISLLSRYSLHIVHTFRQAVNIMKK